MIYVYFTSKKGWHIYMMYTWKEKIITQSKKGMLGIILYKFIINMTTHLSISTVLYLYFGSPLWSMIQSHISNDNVTVDIFSFVHKKLKISILSQWTSSTSLSISSLVLDLSALYTSCGRSFGFFFNLMGKKNSVLWGVWILNWSAFLLAQANLNLSEQSNLQGHS